MSSSHQLLDCMFTCWAATESPYLADIQQQFVASEGAAFTAGEETMWSPRPPGRGGPPLAHAGGQTVLPVVHGGSLAVLVPQHEPAVELRPGQLRQDGHLLRAGGQRARGAHQAG